MIVELSLCWYFFIAERMEVPKSEVLPGMFLFKLGLGALCLRFWNFDCFSCSVKYHCGFIVMHLNRSGVYRFFRASWSKILVPKRNLSECLRVNSFLINLKRRMNDENCCLPSAKLLKRYFSLDFPSEKMRRKGLLFGSPFFFAFSVFSVFFLNFWLKW